MADTVYRQTPKRLEDLFTAAGGGSPPIMGNYSPSPPTEDRQTQDLLRVLMTPEAQGPAPKVNEAPLWAKILMGMGDTFSAGANVLAGGGVGGPTSFEKYQGRQDRQKADLAEWQKKLGESQREAKLLGAKYIMGERDKAQTLAEEKAALTEERAYKEKVARDANKQQAIEETSRRAFELAKTNDSKAWDLEIQKASFAHSEKMKQDEIRARRGDKDAAKVLEQFAGGARIVSGFRTGLAADQKSGSPPVPPLAERLKGGESPDDIRREFEDELTKEGIFGRARDLSRDLFNEKMLRTARALKEEADKPQPEQGPGFFRGGVNTWDEAVSGAMPQNRQ